MAAIAAMLCESRLHRDIRERAVVTRLAARQEANRARRAAHLARTTEAA
jgi:hypothetical protein